MSKKCEKRNFRSKSCQLCVRAPPACADLTPPLALSRTLQHHALLQCLAQCTEVTPYLVVMEFCPLVSIQTTDSLTSDYVWTGLEGPFVPLQPGAVGPYDLSHVLYL